MSTIRQPSAPEASGAVAVGAELKRAVLYLRVSTPSQVKTDYDPEGISIPAQRASCERKVASMGDVEIVGTYVEPGKSATSMDKREAFQAMLERIRTERDVNYVVVYKLSRMNRNRIDDAQVLIQLRRYGVTLISATEQIDATPVGQLMHGILAAFNEFRSAEDGADIAYKMGEKARRGGTLGRAPIGYLNVRETFDGHEVRTVEVDPERAPLVRLAFELYATGEYTIDALAEELEHRGLRTRPGRYGPSPLSTTHVMTVLQNRYYIGCVTYRGEEIEGRHDPIVEPELFEQVQTVIAFRGGSHVRKRRHDHYLKGRLWCYACHKSGREFRLIRQQSKGHGGVYDYFFCRGKQEHVCTTSHIWVDEIEDAVVDFYARLRPPEDFIELVRKHVAAVVADEERSKRLHRKQIERQLTDLSKKEDNLLDLAAEGDLPSAKVRARLKEIANGKAKLGEELSHIELNLAVGAALMNDGLELLQNVQGLYRQASPSQRQLFNRALFRKLYVLDNRVVRAEFNEPFDEFISAWDLLPSSGTTFATWAPEPEPIYENRAERLVRALSFAGGSSNSAMVDLVGAYSNVGGSSNSLMVGAEGLEPPTCWL